MDILISRLAERKTCIRASSHRRMRAGWDQVRKVEHRKLTIHDCCRAVLFPLILLKPTSESSYVRRKVVHLLHRNRVASLWLPISDTKSRLQRSTKLVTSNHAKTARRTFQQPNLIVAFHMRTKSNYWVGYLGACSIIGLCLMDVDTTCIQPC